MAVAAPAYQAASMVVRQNGASWQFAHLLFLNKDRVAPSSAYMNGLLGTTWSDFWLGTLPDKLSFFIF